MTSNKEFSSVAPNTGAQVQPFECKSVMTGAIGIVTVKVLGQETQHSEAQECSRLGAACFVKGLPPCWH